MDGQTSDRFSRALRNSRIASFVAFIYGLAIAIGALTLGVYSSETVTSDGVISKSSDPLVSDPTAGQWLLLLMPAILALAVATLSQLALNSDARGLLIAAWVPPCAAVVFSVLGALTIGIYVLPFAAALTLGVLFAQTAFDIHRAEAA